MRTQPLALFIGLGLVFSVARPAHALPKWAREYHVTCQACHSIPPRLNTFGLAFQANYFNWPDDTGPKKRQNLTTIASATVVGSLEHDRLEDKTTTSFRELNLIAADGFMIGRRRGGYGISAIAATKEQEGRSGDLEYAFVSLPFAGRRGQWAATFGQLNPINFQFNHHNNLSHEPAASALEAEIDGFSLVEPGPALRVDFFDRRGQGTADGNYVSVGVPFGGALAFHSGADVDDAHGAFLHAFRRKGWTSLGVFGFTHAGNHLEGLIGTHEFGRRLYLTGIGALGHDDEGSTRRLSLDAEYVLSSRLAFGGRLELLGGAQDDTAGVASVTVYPFKSPVLRLTGEVVERKEERRYILYARGQF